jgi:glycine/D-amino acid oxidase-like deaminating enzyme
MKSDEKDLVIIGGGIMGLMTAYYASAFVDNIVVLEKRSIGNKEASSFSFTRSMRTDFLDPFYARLAYEAQQLWADLQYEATEELYVQCGCLNIAKRSITPELDKTYASKSYDVIEALNFGAEKLSKQALGKRFPQFEADLGCLDTKGGYMNLTAITALLLTLLKARGVSLVEYVELSAITEQDGTVRITTNVREFNAKKVVITAGVWANDVIRLVVGNKLALPIRLDKPQERKYYYPPRDKIALFTPDKFPVFAYLDLGIYGHPVFDTKKGAVKISYYRPQDLTVNVESKIDSISAFVDECLPGLRGARSEDVQDADYCSYDFVSDDNFILGSLPGFRNILVGAGWRGTGYKFAPLIGKMLSQLAVQEDTVYNIARFSLERFTQ